MNNEEKQVVIDAIGDLLAANPDDKVPNVDVVSEKAGIKVNAAQRDEALKAYHEAVAKADAEKAEEAKAAADAEKAKADAEAKAKADADAKAKADADAAAKAAANAEGDESDSDAPVVTNNHSGAMSFHGVRIEPGESKPVKGFNAKQTIHKLWIERGVIEVS